LAVQSANDTLSNSDRAHLQAEVNQLLSEVDRIGTATQFNNVVLLNNNTAVGSFKFHIGANAETTSMVGANEVSLYSSTLNATAAGLSITTVNVSTQTASNAVISALDAAVETVSTQRGLMGAMQNRLEHSIESLGVASENAGAANSRIRDADVAKAVSEMVRTQILQQSTMAVLAQANQAPQMALQLLK